MVPHKHRNTFIMIFRSAQQTFNLATNQFDVKYNCTKFQHDFGEGLQAPIIMKGIFSDHNMLRLGSISS